MASWYNGIHRQKKPEFEWEDQDNGKSLSWCCTLGHDTSLDFGVIGYTRRRSASGSCGRKLLFLRTQRTMLFLLLHQQRILHLGVDSWDAVLLRRVRICWQMRRIRVLQTHTDPQRAQKNARLVLRTDCCSKRRRLWSRFHFCLVYPKAPLSYWTGVAVNKSIRIPSLRENGQYRPSYRPSSLPSCSFRVLGD